MTILHVIPFLWSGAGRVLTRLCAEQAAHHTVHVVTTGRGHGSQDWPAYRRELRAAGAVHHRVDTYDRTAAAFWTAVTQLTTLIDTLAPDVLHSHAGTPTAACAIARERSRRARVPLVAHMYSWGTDRPAWMDVMDLWGFAQADAVVCSARRYRAVLEAGGVRANRLHYVPWGIDLPPTARGRAPRAGRIGFVGRIEPRKNQLALVHAAAALGRRAAVHLDLVGPVADAAYAARVFAASAKAPAGTVVRQRGRVREVWPLLSSWDLFVSLSRDEGQGLAMLEAMATGVPVAAYRVSGVEDYLEEGRTGVVITPGTPAHVASQLESALARPEALQRMARNARRLVEQRYSWAVTLAALDALYRRVRR